MSSVLVVGASRGIGLELARQFQRRGDSVVATCRTPSPDLDKLGVRTISGLDVADETSVRRMAEQLQGVNLDVVVHNAGIGLNDALETLDVELVREHFEVNTLGPLRVALALLPQLRAGARLALITSRLGSISDNSSGSLYGYRISKAGLNMLGVNLARDLRAQRIAVGILHPGTVATEMTDWEGAPVAEAAQGLIERIDELDLENSGTFWHANGEVLGW